MSSRSRKLDNEQDTVRENAAVWRDKLGVP
jgi:hypothetical protein